MRDDVATGVPGMTEANSTGMSTARCRPRISRRVVRVLPAMVLLVLFVAACGSSSAPSAPPSQAAPPSEFTRTTQATAVTSPPQTSAPLPGPPDTKPPQTPFVTTTSSGAPTSTLTPGPTPPPSHAVQGLITRNAQWRHPPFLTEGVTDNIALIIGDAQALQDAINANVPNGVAGPPVPVTVTVGTVVRAKLTVISSDAEIKPLDTIDKSIGENVNILFPWEIQPHIVGDLVLQATISCPRADGRITTENVPLRIPVHAAVKHEPGLSDRLHGFLELLKTYWVQITAISGVVAAAARFGWKWYGRRRVHGNTADAHTGADSDKGGRPDTESKPKVDTPSDQEETPAVAPPPGRIVVRAHPLVDAARFSESSWPPPPSPSGERRPFTGGLVRGEDRPLLVGPGR